MQINFKYEPGQMIRTKRGHVGRVVSFKAFGSTANIYGKEYEVEFIKPGLTMTLDENEIECEVIITAKV